MTATLFPDRAEWQLEVSVDEWLESLPIVLASAIENALANGSAKIRDDNLIISATEVASWSESVATGLALPPNAPYGFDIRLTGAIGRTGASVSVRWLQPGRTIAARDVTHRGLQLDNETRSYRVASPIFEILGLIEQFNSVATSTPDEQFRIWAEIRNALGDASADNLTDGFLRSFRVIAANSLTFGISTDQRGNVQLDPVLLSKSARDDEGNEKIVRALTDADDALFAKRLEELRSGASAFPISQGTYVVVTEGLQKTLAALKMIRSAPPELRKRAAMFPEAVLRETLDVSPDEPIAFIETEKFADRVLDVGAWESPVVPWIKIESQEWGAPVTSGIRINGQNIPLERKTLIEIAEKVKGGIEKGVAEVTVGDTTLPATSSTLTAIGKLISALNRKDGGLAPNEKSDAVDSVLIIETNFENASFTRVKGSPRPGEASLPDILKTSPKPHQEAGLRWLQQHWITGSRGCLLCDDMGLGKTFQALAFLAWLRSLMDSGQIEKRPILIVAPVGLLRNWEQEIETHLLSPGLGDVTRAYGEHLKSLRRGRHVDGTASLDTAILSRSDLILANYEAVSDYQISFGAVPYRAVIFDEAQKIKSPKARMTHAAKALNADFVVGMTGTPVENRLADLWCIADTAQPGVLSNLKEFSAQYEVDGANLGSLREQIWQPDDVAIDSPRLLLRRLKSNNLKGLPRKHEHVVQVDMPDRQRECYERALALREISGPEGTLGMIHALRRASLHPVLADGAAGKEELRIEDSARFISTIRFLDKIAEAGEKCLIFLESLDLQEAGQLPLMLKRRYGLARLPMVINGEVSTDDRQKIVGTFQTETGFDVMLLSPKAGGVGLTLTAANHVIHLSRWWNPAVEDQCSDRVYRIGQTRDVNIYYPLAVLPGAADRSFDTQLQLLMERKRTLAKSLLVAPAFNKQDYDTLLSSMVN